MKGATYCAYCRQFKSSDAGFKVVVHPGSGSKRQQCGDCQSIRKRPREELTRLAQVEVEARKEAARLARTRRNDD